MVRITPVIAHSTFQPLAGIRVHDITQVLAGPYASYQLALMGADVVEIERPGDGDWTRNGGPVAHLTSAKIGVSCLAPNLLHILDDLSNSYVVFNLKRLAATRHKRLRHNV